METVLIIAANIAAVLLILVIWVYLIFDKYRFQIERQYSCVKDDVVDIVKNIGQEEEYTSLKKTADKICFLTKLQDTVNMEPLQGYMDVHNELAHRYNMRLSLLLVRPFAKLLRLKPYPTFH